jgi:hypothetical protein
MADFGRNCARTSQQDFFLSELAKVFNEEENLSKLSAFFYVSDYALACLSSSIKKRNSKRNMVIQLSNITKTKGAATSESLSRTSRHRS